MRTEFLRPIDGLRLAEEYRALLRPDGTEDSVFVHILNCRTGSVPVVDAKVRFNLGAPLRSGQKQQAVQVELRGPDETVRAFRYGRYLPPLSNIRPSSAFVSCYTRSPVAQTTVVKRTPARFRVHKIRTRARYEQRRLKRISRTATLGGLFLSFL